jgi:hypothetical protein
VGQLGLFPPSLMRVWGFHQCSRARPLTQFHQSLPQMRKPKGGFAAALLLAIAHGRSPRTPNPSTFATSRPFVCPGCCAGAPTGPGLPPCTEALRKAADLRKGRTMVPRPRLQAATPQTAARPCLLVVASRRSSFLLSACADLPNEAWAQRPRPSDKHVSTTQGPWPELSRIA